MVTRSAFVGNNNSLFVFHYHPLCFPPHLRCAKHVGHRIFCKDCACERLCAGNLYECGASPCLAELIRRHLNPRPARNAWASESFAKTRFCKGTCTNAVPRRASPGPCAATCIQGPMGLHTAQDARGCGQNNNHAARFKP